MKQLSVMLGVGMVAGLAGGAVVSVGEASLLGDQLTIPVVLDETASVDIYMGYGGPKDSPENLQQVVKTVSLDAGSSTVTIQIPVGAKVSYAARTTDSVSETRTITAIDSSEYTWVNNSKGNWEDPANWIRADGNDVSHIGYPAYTTGQVRFNGNQTAEVTLNADYSSGDLRLDNSNLDITIHGNGHTYTTGNAYTASDNTYTLDNVRIKTGGFKVQSRSLMTLKNGASFDTTWEFWVSGTNAQLYVGPGCEMNIGSGWWWTLNLDGNGSLITIDDAYVHTRGFRIGSDSNRDGTAPAGVVFKGQNPRLELYEEFVVCRSNIPSRTVFEFYVPVGGYAVPPIQKRDAKENFPAFDNKWQDHTSSTSVYKGIKFKVNPYSPFFQEEQTQSICLVDWSNCSAETPILTSQVTFIDFEIDPLNNRMEFRSSDGGNVDQIWAVLKGTGTPADLPTLSGPVTATTDNSTGKITYISGVTGTSSSYTTTLELWVGTGGPGVDVAAKMVKVLERVVTESGDITLLTDGIMGAKIAYKVVLVASNGTKSWTCGSSETQTFVFRDSHTRRYNWMAGATGEWTDSGNWTLEGEDDGVVRIGYPTWGADVGFYGSQTDVVYVGEDIEDLHEIILGWGGANLSFICTNKVEGVTVEVGGFRDGQYENVQVLLDGVSFDTLGSNYPSTYHIKKNSSLTMRNGSHIKTKWEFTLEGDEAHLYVGTNCLIDVSAAEPWHRFEVSGANSEVVIDNGSIRCIFMQVARSGSAAPRGITFRGESPSLLITDHMGADQSTKVVNAFESSPVFSFEVPAGGYARAPIQKTSGNTGTEPLFARSSDLIPPIVFKVEDDSPFFKAKGRGEFTLVEWANDGNSKGIDTAGTSLAEMGPKRCGSNWLYYASSVEGVEVTAIKLHLYALRSLTISLR